MTRVIIVADSGPALANLTAAVGTVPGAYIVRHGSSTGALDRLVAPLAPDLVLIGDLRTAAAALVRLAEIAGTAPAAKVVLLGDGPEVSWLPDALRARAAAVLPGNVEPRVLAIVLGEVIAQDLPRTVPLRRRRRRPQLMEQAHEGQAA